jgi:hypothetical protein
MPSRAVFERVLNVFDPRQPLQGEELDRYYVARPHAPLEAMKSYLRANQQHVKILFSGHRGSGKSTELARLAKDLDREFFVVRATARSLNVSDLNYVDVILACAASLLQTVTDEGCPIEVPPKLLRDVHGWLTSEITQETTITTSKSGSFGVRVSALILSLQGKYAKETSTRAVLRERLWMRTQDLVDRMNAVCAAIEGFSQPLIIFEDLDKADLALTRELFFDQATTLNSPACRIIYSFPISLRHSHGFAPRRRDYSYDFSLPNIALHNHDDSPNQAARESLRAVIIRRAAEDIFAEGACWNIETPCPGGTFIPLCAS